MIRSSVLACLAGLLALGTPCLAQDAPPQDATTDDTTKPPSLTLSDEPGATASGADAEQLGVGPMTAEKLLERVRKAYEDTRTYRARVGFAIEQAMGRWSNTSRVGFDLAVDRGQKRLAMTGPEWVITQDAEYLRVKIEPLEPRYVEQAAGDATALEDMLTRLRAGSALARSADLNMLNGQGLAPLTQMIGAEADPELLPPRMVRPSVDELLAILQRPDPIDRVYVPQMTGPGLRITGPGGTWSFWVDPDTYLITQAVLETQGEVAGATDTYRYDLRITTHNEPLPDSALTFSTEGLTKVGALRELAPDEQAAVEETGQGEPSHPIVGQAAPDVTALDLDSDQEVSLAALDAEVVVLDFWASWCGPCRAALPGLSRVAAWATTKPVKIIAVNTGEDAATAGEAREQIGFDLPVWLDPAGEISNRYQIQALPTTVVIHKGRVVDVHIGHDPEAEDTLKAQIQELLAEPSAADTASDG